MGDDDRQDYFTASERESIGPATPARDRFGDLSPMVAGDGTASVGAVRAARGVRGVGDGVVGATGTGGGVDKLKVSEDGKLDVPSIAEDTAVESKQDGGGDGVVEEDGQVDKRGGLRGIMTKLSL